MNLSENREDDINELELITKRHISKVGDNDAYALRALSEIQFFSQDCNKSRNYMDKAIELGGTVDIYTIAGSMEQQCDNLEKSVKLYYNALQLQPNDNNYFVSRQLVLSLYLLDRLDDIKELMSKKIKNDDYNLGNIGILVAYSAIEAEEGNLAFEDHLSHLLIHGCLHLVGFDHENESDAELMEGIEKKLLSKLGIKNPYRWSIGEKL